MKNKKLIIGYARTPNRFPSLNLPFKFGSRLMERKIEISVEDCNLFEKFTGLMFSRREKAKILLFSFRRKQKIAIHSFFVFYSFLAVWLDDNNKIVDIKAVKPFQPCISPKKDSYKLVEIPINRKNKKILKFFGDSVVKKQNI